MELRWWAVAIAGFVALAVCIALAELLPLAQTRRRLRPLAHVDRLTRLPEYAAVVRRQWWSMLVTAVLLVIVFAAALVASSRPVGSPSDSGDAAAHPEDIMLCVGEPVTEAVTAGFLNYFARQVSSFETQRIALTSPTLRVVPMTRDYQYAVDRFGRYAKLAAVQQKIEADQPVAAPELAQLRAGVDEFSRSPTYIDYARSVEDILALCLTGFPSFEEPSIHRRSLIYLGHSNIRPADERRPSLFSPHEVTDMASAAGVQINVVPRSDAPDPSLQWVNDLQSIATRSGGRFTVFNPEDPAPDISAGTNPPLVAALDEIRANPPQAALVGGATSTGRSWDSPNVALIVGAVAAALLCGAMAVLRR